MATLTSQQSISLLVKLSERMDIATLITVPPSPKFFRRSVTNQQLPHKVNSHSSGQTTSTFRSLRPSTPPILEVPCHAQMTRQLPLWTKIGANLTVQKWITHGVLVFFHTRPQPFKLKEYPIPSHRKKEWCALRDHFLQIEVIELIPRVSSDYTSLAFLFAKNLAIFGFVLIFATLTRLWLFLRFIMRLFVNVARRSEETIGSFDSIWRIHSSIFGSGLKTKSSSASTSKAKHLDQQLSRLATRGVLTTSLALWFQLSSFSGTLNEQFECLGKSTFENGGGWTRQALFLLISTNLS